MFIFALNDYYWMSVTTFNLKNNFVKLFNKDYMLYINNNCINSVKLNLHV